MNRILLIGATGYAGRMLAALLLKDTDATLILAGRSRAKLDALQSTLPLERYAGRLELLEIDATTFDSASLVDFDLLVNATAAGPHNAALIEACLENRANWIDMQMSNELLDPSAPLRQRIEEAGCCFVIQAGFHPGIGAALVRYADRKIDTMDSAIVATVIRDKGGMPYSSGFSELVASFEDYRSEMYRDGQWRKLGMSEYPTIEFNYDFGRLLTYPLEMPELRLLTEQLPNLRNSGFFVAGFNWFADYVVMPLIMLNARIKSRFIEVALGKLLSWSTRKFSKPPFGTIVQLDAEGRIDGEQSHLRVSLFHRDSYAMTTIPAVSMIKQMLNGELAAGIHLMGLCCDPDNLIEDLGRSEIEVTQRLDS